MIYQIIGLILNFVGSFLVSVEAFKPIKGFTYGELSGECLSPERTKHIRIAGIGMIIISFGFILQLIGICKSITIP